MITLICWHDTGVVIGAAPEAEGLGDALRESLARAEMPKNYEQRVIGDILSAIKLWLYLNSPADACVSGEPQGGCMIRIRARG
jgi:hypothetical protein